MKYYETKYEEYLRSVQHYNIHPNLVSSLGLPESINQLTNLIFYGPPGSGKYSQMLSAIQRYSPSSLEYDKKMYVQNEKYAYQFRISDIHYEVDMGLLGCNAKQIWHDVVQQIVDAVSVKHDKIGIVVCKNFHAIHSELLEIFYSYIQEYRNRLSSIQLRFVLMTEHLGFIPNNIIDTCRVISVGRPSKAAYMEMLVQQPKLRKYTKSGDTTIEEEFVQKISSCRGRILAQDAVDKTEEVLAALDVRNILNMKELNYFGKLSGVEQLPKEVFNIVCNAIIEQMLEPAKLVHTSFRDAIYDIFIYNLDVVECMWYILEYLVRNGRLKPADTSDILTRMYGFLKYFNNNYRPIYHLESMFHYMIIKIFDYDELPAGV
jgi:hypothetical protein